MENHNLNVGCSSLEALYGSYTAAMYLLSASCFAMMNAPENDLESLWSLFVFERICFVTQDNGYGNHSQCFQCVVQLCFNNDVLGKP